METVERDLQHIADTLRLLRKMRGLTQENLAEAANLATRTIEKIESGRHRPWETLEQDRVAVPEEWRKAN